MNTKEPQPSPCPFCGAQDAELGWISLALTDKPWLRSVLCHCGAHGPARDDEAEAVQLWNKRVPPPTPPPAKEEE